jgi:uncharacterized protein (UPF0548 family)
MVSGLTYPEVGATAGELPPGYHHLRRSALLGHGSEDFVRAAEALMTWDMHRRSGLTVPADTPPVELGGDVRLTWSVGPARVSIPCRVVRVVDEASVRGFAYGTLPGHPEQGEESFMVRRDEDGAVTLEIVAFSRPGRWWSRLGAPVAAAVQRRVTDRYLNALVTTSSTS